MLVHFVASATFAGTKVLRAYAHAVPHVVASAAIVFDAVCGHL